jgi:hypothetical protein
VITVLSPSGVPIRLTEERWGHIIDEHGELFALHDDVLQTVAAPDRILEGGAGELLAVRMVEPAKWLVVVYREMDGDGFIITAFLTRKFRSLDRRRQLWP